MMHDISSDFLVCFKLVRKSRPPVDRTAFDLVSAWLVLCVCQTCSFHGHILRTLLVVLLEQMCCSFPSHCAFYVCKPRQSVIVVPFLVTCEMCFLGNRSLLPKSVSPQVNSPNSNSFRPIFKVVSFQVICNLFTNQ